jgi:hypothetical protein
MLVSCRTTDYVGLTGVLNNWTTSNNSSQNMSRPLWDVWEVPNYAGTSFSTRTSAFFKAPVAGAYRFLMVVDDYAIMQATWLEVRAEGASAAGYLP